MLNNEMIGKLDRDEKGLYYDYLIRITLEETNIEGTVSHDQFARLFGKTRELFGLECIPGFADPNRDYLLHTYSASYNFKKSFHFGDIVIVRVRVLGVENCSFRLGVEFINKENGEIYVTGEQTIIYTDKNGKPKKIPPPLRGLLQDALLPLSI